MISLAMASIDEHIKLNLVSQIRQFSTGTRFLKTSAGRKQAVKTSYLYNIREKIFA